MLRMDQIHVVRHKVLVEGCGVREASRALGLHRATIRKYLRDPVPGRGDSAPRPRPVREAAERRIAEIVEAWSSRTTRKQRLTGTRLHRQLRAEGLVVGATTVRAVLREHRRRSAEVFIPLVRRPGEEAQVDFFEVAVVVAGARRKAWLFLFRLLYSGRDFAWLYDRQDQVVFLDGHVRAFAELGGVVSRITYDNTSLAVRRVARAGRELTPRFRALAAHFAFEPCFARVGEGHDKGSVESRGKSLRWQHLVPVPEGRSLEEISRSLLGSLAAQASQGEVLRRFEEERPLLRASPGAPFECRRVVPVAVRSNATVRVDNVWYSVPCGWARADATAYVGVDDVEIVRAGERVRHPRGRAGEKRIAYRHYLPELAAKPQAVRQVADALVPELGPPYDRLWRLLLRAHGEREAARVLAAILGALCRHGEEAVRQALDLALAGERLDLLALARVVGRPRVAEVPVPETLAGHVVEATPLADYDRLLVAEACA